jgi:hypothetical protein
MELVQFGLYTVDCICDSRSVSVVNSIALLQ